jgi:hypothetical protein
MERSNSQTLPTFAGLRASSHEVNQILTALDNCTGTQLYGLSPQDRNQLITEIRNWCTRFEQYHIRMIQQIASGAGGASAAA